MLKLYRWPEIFYCIHDTEIVTHFFEYKCAESCVNYRIILIRKTFANATSRHVLGKTITKSEYLKITLAKRQSWECDLKITCLPLIRAECSTIFVVLKRNANFTRSTESRQSPAYVSPTFVKHTRWMYSRNFHIYVMNVISDIVLWPDVPNSRGNVKWK